MKRSFVLALILAILMGIQSVRAEVAKACPQGRAVFGRLVCTGVTSSEALFDAYFYGATSLAEIQTNFPVRAAKLGERCRKKLLEIQLAAAPKSAAIERVAVRYRYEPAEVCLGKRGYQRPCVRDEDCLENFCHPERGTCSKVFTVPISAAQ